MKIRIPLTPTPPLPELLPVNSMSPTHNDRHDSDNRSSNDDDVMIIYENIPSKMSQDRGSEDIPLDLSLIKIDGNKENLKNDSPISEKSILKIRADLYEARTFNILPGVTSSAENEKSRKDDVTKDQNLFWKMKYESLVQERAVKLILLSFTDN